MIEINKETFEAEVMQAQGVVMVDFWGDTCDNCLNLMPDVEKLAEQYGKSMKFCKLNIKGNRRLAIAQKVMGLPAVVFYRDGEKLEQLGGEDLSAEEIETAIKKHCEHV